MPALESDGARNDAAAMTTTSRQCVIDALNHKQPERIPVDLSGHRSSGIMAVAYARLKKALGIATGDIYVYDMVQQLAIVEPPVLDALGIDTVEMGRGFLQDPADWKEWVLPDGTPCKIPKYIQVEKREDTWVLLAEDGRELGIQKPGCLYFEQTHFPMVDRDFENDSFEDMADQFAYTQWTAVPHPGAHMPLDEAGLAELAAGARRLRESTDRAVIGLFGGNMFEIPQFLCRQDNYLLNMSLYPEATRRFSERLVHIHLDALEKWLRAVGPYIDVILFGDDLGGQRGPLFSPKMYREYYKPYHKALWQRSKQIADVKVMLHCCGGVEPLLDDLIDAGLDAINPVQISCSGMEARELKSKFGDRMCFWGGGCDTQHVLSRGTPREVKEHVKQQAAAFAPGGGFVFQQVHNIMADVPPENVIAMYEAVREV
jgi:uroporphyrinogen decarboxylase